MLLLYSLILFYFIKLFFNCILNFTLIFSLIIIIIIKLNAYAIAKHSINNNNNTNAFLIFTLEFITHEAQATSYNVYINPLYKFMHILHKTRVQVKQKCIILEAYNKYKVKRKITIIIQKLYSYYYKL